MTRFQKGFCVILCLCFFGVLAVMPEPFSSFENPFRILPLYRYLEEKGRLEESGEDGETLDLIAKNNGAYLAGLVEKENAESQSSAEIQAISENQDDGENQNSSKAGENGEAQEGVETGNIAETQDIAETDNTAEARNAAEAQEEKEVSASIEVQANPILDLSAEKLADLDYVLNNFYVADENTTADAAPIDAVKFLSEDLTMQQDASLPQILIYHSHSQETFADSREGVAEDTVVGVGDYLTQLLEENYGYNVIHVTETFDIIDGVLDRSGAYDNARQTIEQVLEENPSVEVVIDLHRDGVAEDRRLVTEINGKETAQIMFYNGLSYTLSGGTVTYLPNPYIEDNLAFSFQLEYQAALYYPEFYRCIYLAGLRYNLHLRPKALLLEAGAQTNTLQEVKNAMEPFADILNRVLTGS